MNAEELRMEYAAKTTGEMPFLTNYAKWLENRIEQTESKLPSEEMKIRQLYEETPIDEEYPPIGRHLTDLGWVHFYPKECIRKWDANNIPTWWLKPTKQ